MRLVGHCWLLAVIPTVAAKVGLLLILTVPIPHSVPLLVLIDAVDHCILVGWILHA
jgi:hypothetical protein